MESNRFACAFSVKSVSPFLLGALNLLLEQKLVSFLQGTPLFLGKIVFFLARLFLHYDALFQRSFRKDAHSARAARDQLTRLSGMMEKLI